MPKISLAATIVASVALVTSAAAEPFGAGRFDEPGARPSPRARAAEERRGDFWEGRDHSPEQRSRRRHRQPPPPGQNAGGYPYAYGAPNGGYWYGGGYGGDYANPPPRPAPPPSPRGLHDGLWYY
ncbi:hypothetical protein IY145_19315 [Methylosinus sp. H3A]|uniref:hypothetical protein n=1 Tax=Methylosinus sp. H3A TaxID=2785786 RepID=UPI0018C32254|nr:hypothetical protein [Methylosinus sp. H3A]MBG0811506.1 hypothetical protein [Methylosinus sp. H3A]